MRPKIILIRTDGYKFRGIWFDPKLTPAELQTLGMSEQPGEVGVEGEFHIEWDADIAMPYVDVVLISETAEALVIDESRIDYTDIEQALYCDGDYSTWYYDKVSS